MVYQRDEKLVAKASKIMVDCQNQEQRDHAARLLQESEQMIDDNASKEFGMRFMGISELKTLGGPFAGLFYNDDAIVLVFKGTSVLAFSRSRYYNSFPMIGTLSGLLTNRFLLSPLFP
jgi:hypothetical protein